MSFISDFDAIVDCPGLSPAELGLLVYFFRHQGKSFVFCRKNILKKFGIKETAYYTALNGLIEKHLISHSQKNSGKFGGLQITVNMPVIRAECEKSESGKTVYGKSAHGNPEHGESEFGKSGHNKGVNKKGSKSSKGVKAAVAAEGDSLSAPAGAADSPSPENSPSQEGKTKAAKASSKASKAAAIPLSQNPPSQTDVEAAVSQTAANSKIPGWTPEAISFKAFAIWNHYELKQWKRADGTDITDLNSCVFCWMKRDGFNPPVMDSALQQTPAPVPSSGLLPAQKTSNAAEKQKSFKQMQQEWIERPLTDPDAFIVESAAHSIFNATCEDEVQGTLNSTPVHLRERALALAEQMRKEQGGRPRIINTPSTFTYENEDKTS